MSFASTTATATQPVMWKIRNQLDSSNPLLEYVGYATPYTAESTAGWMITRNTYDETTGRMIKSDFPVGQFADGRMKFNQRWDNRESIPFA